MCLFCAATPEGEFYALTRDGTKIPAGQVATWVRERIENEAQYSTPLAPYRIVLLDTGTPEWEPFFVLRDRYGYDQLCGRGFFLDVLYAQQDEQLVEKL